MLQVAIAHGWHGIDGVQVRPKPSQSRSGFGTNSVSQAMIEQGLAQQRMWYTSVPTIEVGSDHNILGHVDLPARNICETMGDVVLVGEEIDRADGKDFAPRK
jgi:quinate dehydrogenase